MNILVSGLLNTETTVPVKGFPIPYFPIDYPFFGVNTAPSGVALNIAKALHTLGDSVRLCSMTGNDYAAGFIRNALEENGISHAFVTTQLKETPSSVVLYAPDGQRQIYCDLKDIQESNYPFSYEILKDMHLVVACNTNFNRPLLHLAKAAGVPIATDVHVLSDIHDEYNRKFMEMSDILFLSDEHIGENYRPFLQSLAATYGSSVIVLGRGSKGAAIYLRRTNQIYEQPAVQAGIVVNTVGAGDALFSGFLHFYSKGCDPLAALQRAQIFAACKITVSGASNGFPTESKVESYIKNKF